MPRYVALCMSLNAIALLCTTSSAEDAGYPLQVTLSTPKQVFVLGDPVPLEVSVKNTGQEVIKTYDIIDHSHGSCPEFGIYIARENDGFESYVPGNCIQADLEPRRVFDFKPNESLDYQLRILYDDAPPSNLALPKPGEYRIAVRHPQFGGVGSNVVNIRVTEPQGIDAEVRKAIQSQKFLYFLHWGAVAKEGADTALRAAELLKSHTESSYHDGLRWALREYYRSHRSLPEHEAQLIRDVTGITEKEPEKLFADDARLDQVVTYHFPNQTPLEEVLQKLSRQSGVSLTLNPKLRHVTMATIRITQPLRKFMQSLSGTHAHWAPKGDGYVLAPESGSAEKNE